MNVKRVVLILLAVMIAPMAWPQQPGRAADSNTPAPEPRPYTVETALIEQVVTAVDDGYQFDAYIVRWHGSRILVSDVIGLTHRMVGDSIKFLASHHDVHGNRLLSFIGADPDSRPGSRTSESSSKVSASSSSELATIDEVLSAEEDGFRFVAYLATWHGMQIAVSDTLALSRYSLGEQLRFTARKLAMNGDRNLSFSVDPASANDLARAHEAKSTEEMALIDEVLTAGIDGYRFLAYVVQWHGTHVAVLEPPEATPQQVGETVALLVSQPSMPEPTSGSILSFESGSASGDDSGHADAVDLSTAYETATVNEVLSAQRGESRYMAYVVKWHDRPVVVTDMFATTHHAVGDTITFSVSRQSFAGRRNLNFMLFEFPKPQAEMSTCAAQARNCNRVSFQAPAAARKAIG